MRRTLRAPVACTRAGLRPRMQAMRELAWFAAGAAAAAVMAALLLALRPLLRGPRRPAFFSGSAAEAAPLWSGDGGGDSGSDGDDSDEGGVAAGDPNGLMKLVLVVRNDLKMGKGKIGAQCGHGAVAALMHAMRSRSPMLEPWLRQGQRKIALRVDSERELRAVHAAAKAANLPASAVRDAGKTQIASGSLTVLAIGPASEAQIDAVTGGLKLL